MLFDPRQHYIAEQYRRHEHKVEMVAVDGRWFGLHATLSLSLCLPFFAKRPLFAVINCGSYALRERRPER